MRTTSVLGVCRERLDSIDNDLVRPARSDPRRRREVDTRDLPTPGGRIGSTTKRVRVRYQATAASTPTFTVSFARGPEDASFTALNAIRGGGASDGLDESVWQVAKRAPAIRFRIESTSALSSFTLRSLEAQYLPRGL